MPRFGNSSKNNLNTCDDRLIRVAELSVKIFDMSIIKGYRGEEEQMKAYNAGTSNAKFLESPHNYMPSLAFDSVPYYKTNPHIRWGSTREILNHYSIMANDKKTLKKLLKDFSKEIGAFYIMSSVIRMVAMSIGVEVVSGGDWDGDWDITDQTFDDLPHTELKNWKDMV